MFSGVEGVVFEPQHAYEIELREYESSYMSREWIVSMGASGNCNTVYKDNVILMILGYLEEWPGVIRVFVIPSIHVPRYAKAVVRFVKNSLDRLANDFGYHRMHTESLANERTDKWMQVLGFTCEGTLRAYSSTKEDYKVWARLS